MATQFFYLEGEVNWAKVQEPVLKYQSKDEYEWSIDFKPNDVKEFKKTKSRKNIKNGFVKLNRSTKRLNKDGDIVEEEPPKILLRTDEGENEPFTGLIGNGSKAIVKIAVYDTRMGKGTRLEGLVVLNLVPYDGTPQGPITSTDGEMVLPF